MPLCAFYFLGQGRMSHAEDSCVWKTVENRRDGPRGAILKIFDNARMEANGLPSRTSISTVAALAFGASEPDPSCVILTGSPSG
jgi:hypothetical protein